jgi:hypothetical protein
MNSMYRYIHTRSGGTVGGTKYYRTNELSTNNDGDSYGYRTLKGL